MGAIIAFEYGPKVFGKGINYYFFCSASMSRLCGLVISHMLSVETNEI